MPVDISTLAFGQLVLSISFLELELVELLDEGEFKVFLPRFMLVWLLAVDMFASSFEVK